MNEVITTDNNQMPDYLKGVEKKSYGNLDSSDLIIPRIKLMQKTSPELDIYEELRSGDLYHTVMEDTLGKSVNFIPMQVIRTYVIWDIRESETPILARSSDGINWDNEYQNTEILYRHKDDKKGRKIKLGVAVGDNGLDQFGTSKLNDEGSAPIATLTYDWLIWVENVGPMMLTLSRSGVKPSQGLYGKIEMRNTPPHAQRYEMSSRVQGDGAESYMVYTFKASGWADKAQFDTCEAFLENNKDRTIRSNDDYDGDDKKSAPLRNDI